VLGGVRGEVLGVDFLGILRDVARGGPRLAAPGARRGDVRVEEAGRKSRRVRTVAVAAATSPEGFLFCIFFVARDEDGFGRRTSANVGTRFSNARDLRDGRLPDRASRDAVGGTKIVRDARKNRAERRLRDRGVARLTKNKNASFRRGFSSFRFESRRRGPTVCQCGAGSRKIGSGRGCARVRSRGARGTACCARRSWGDVPDLRGTRARRVPRGVCAARRRCSYLPGCCC
jgi:hypothetical protein